MYMKIENSHSLKQKISCEYRGWTKILVLFAQIYCMHLDFNVKTLSVSNVQWVRQLSL